MRLRWLDAAPAPLRWGGPRLHHAIARDERGLYLLSIESADTFSAAALDDLTRSIGGHRAGIASLIEVCAPDVETSFVAGENERALPVPHTLDGCQARPVRMPGAYALAVTWPLAAHDAFVFLADRDLVTGVVPFGVDLTLVDGDHGTWVSEPPRLG